MTVRELQEILQKCDPDAPLLSRPALPKNITGTIIIGTIAHMGGVMSVPMEFHTSWVNMIRYNSEFLETGEAKLHYDYGVVSHHATARNILSKRILGEWILMMDTDHSFEPDIVERMLKVVDKHPEVEVLSALYHHKTPPYGPNVCWWDEELNSFTIVPELPDVDLWGGEEFASGAGCLLIRKHVLDRIENELREYPFDQISGYEHANFTNQYTEDLSFFIRCRKLGIKSFVAPKIESHHLQCRGLSSKDRIRQTEAVTTA